MPLNLGRWQFSFRPLPFHVHLTGDPPVVATIERRWIFGAWRLPRREATPPMVYGLELGPIGVRFFVPYGEARPAPWHVHRFREVERVMRWTPAEVYTVQVRKACRCGAKRWSAWCDVTAQWYRMRPDEIEAAQAREDADGLADHYAHNLASAVRACGGV